MSGTRSFAAGYLDSLLAGQRGLPASPLPWLNELRAEAVDRVGVLTVPTIRDEEWRFTDLSPFTKLSFQPGRMPIGLKAADVEHFRIAEATTRLVFVDGVHAPELCSVAPDGGVVVANLSVAGSTHAAVVDLHLGRHVQIGMPLGRHAEPTVPLLELVYSRQISIMGTRGIAASRFPVLFAMISSLRIQPSRLVTHRISLDQAGAAIEAMNGYTGSGITVIDRF
jgi:hypothetical protein